MASVIWKGVLRFADVRVPVKLYSAIEDRTVHFHLLHAKDGVRVKQKLVNPTTGNDVPPENVAKGYEITQGTFVLFEPEELRELEPEPNRDVEITRFVDRSALGSEWYGRPYYVAADGSDELHAAFTEALARSGRQAIAKWTMRRRRYVGALRPAGGHLVLVTLRHKDEVLATPKIEAPPARRDARETALAEQLVSALAGDFDPSAFHDEHRARLLELVQAKAQGKAIAIPRRPHRRREEPLAAALAGSLERLKKERRSA
jgi:DNA end-binding protein Ku